MDQRPSTAETQEQLYQLEFVVKTVTQCGGGGKDDGGGGGGGGCGSTIGVQFAGHKEQTVCHVPAATGRGCGAGPTAVCVDRGKTYTFAGPAGPPCVPVRLYMRRQSDRVQIASGRLEVPLQPWPPRPDAAGARAADEQAVAVVGCADGRTVAVLTVLARAWLAGHVAVAEVPRAAQCAPAPPQCAPVSPQCVPVPPKCAPAPTPKAECCADPPKAGCSAPDLSPGAAECCARDRQPRVTCCARDQPPRAKRCDERREKPASACCDGRKKRPCCAAQRTCRRHRDACTAAPAPDVPEPHRQYTSIGCEIDGRKVDLRVRKKNYETCAVQKKIATEAEAFAARVMTAVREMHELVTTTIGTKSDDSM